MAASPFPIIFSIVLIEKGRKKGKKKKRGKLQKRKRGRERGELFDRPFH